MRSRALQSTCGVLFGMRHSRPSCEHTSQPFGWHQSKSAPTPCPRCDALIELSAAHFVDCRSSGTVCPQIRIAQNRSGPAHVGDMETVNTTKHPCDACETRVCWCQAYSALVDAGSH